MANKLIKVGDTSNTPIYQYVVDEASDLSDCDATFGNIALCLDDGKLYMCDSTGNWTAIG